MRRVELIGPAGVGKSTLYKNLLNSRKATGQWLTTKEANFKIVSHILSSRNMMASLLYKPQLPIPLLTGYINRSILKSEYKVAIDEIKALPNLKKKKKIDTHQPYEQVLKTAKEFIWNNL